MKSVRKGNKVCYGVWEGDVIRCGAINWDLLDWCGRGVWEEDVMTSGTACVKDRWLGFIRGVRRRSDNVLCDPFGTGLVWKRNVRKRCDEICYTVWEGKVIRSDIECEKGDEFWYWVWEGEVIRWVLVQSVRRRGDKVSTETRREVREGEAMSSGLVVCYDQNSLTNVEDEC